MERIFNISMIILSIILFIYLIVAGYFVYKYVTNRSVEDEIYYHNKIKVISIVGAILDILSVLSLIIVYIIERRINKRPVTTIRRKFLHPEKETFETETKI